MTEIIICTVWIVRMVPAALLAAMILARANGESYGLAIYIGIIWPIGIPLIYMMRYTYLPENWKILHWISPAYYLRLLHEWVEKNL